MKNLGLTHLEALAKVATPGVWRLLLEHGNCFSVLSQDGTVIVKLWRRYNANFSANAAFIAACSPDVLLALIARVRKLEKALELYGQHDNDCPCVGEVVPHSLECKDCDCGLNATFTSLEAPDA